ncbi:MAG: class I SAM-dependent methyltransferase [Acidobacteriota bacterium]
MRDFRAELAGDRCWDLRTEEIFSASGEPLDDCILQNREELIGLCELIEAQQIGSYLEIGIWTGRLLTTLHRLFQFERVAACDHGWAEELGLTIRVPAGTSFLHGSSDSPAFRSWREDLGPIDLVLIDANHSYRAVRSDFEINRGFPHRFLALHDITGHRRQTEGVAKFWRELSGGRKQEIVRPHRELGLAHSTMGIGVWSET